MTLQRSISYFLLDNQLNKATRKSTFAALQSAVAWCGSRFTGASESLLRLPVELWLSMAKRWL